MASSAQFYQQAIQGIHWYLQREMKLLPGQDYGFLAASDNPRTVAISMWITPSKFRMVTNQNQELSLAARLDAEMSVRVARGERGTALLEVPKPEALWFHLNLRQLPQRGGLKVFVGLNQQRHPSALDFNDPATPHLLIAGGTGGGKTNSGTVIIRHCAAHTDPNEVQVLLFDVEKRGLHWGVFERMPHLAHPIIYDYEEAKRVLRWVIGEIGRRQEERRKTPHLFLFVDEWGDMAEADREIFIPWMAKISRMGRDYNVHLVLLIQNPTMENVGHTDIARNMIARLVARVDSAVAAKVAAGQDGTGAHQLTGKGDQLLLQPAQPIQRITVPMVEKRDFENLPRVEQVHQLPLLSEADPDQVEEKPAAWPVLKMDEILLGGGASAEPVTLDQVAYALGSNRGITHLAERFGISGNRGGKAYRLRELAAELRQRMLNFGYVIIPVSENVTG